MFYCHPPATQPGVRSSGVVEVPAIQVEDIRARLTRRFGPAVDGWCAELPALVDTMARRWGLRPGPVWPIGGTSVVLPCQAAHGEEMVLGLSPDTEDRHR